MSFESIDWDALDDDPADRDDDVKSVINGAEALTRLAAQRLGTVVGEPTSTIDTVLRRLLNRGRELITYSAFGSAL